MKNNILHLKQAVTSQTFKHSIISFGGTGITGILGVVFYAFVARTIGPANNGIFAVAVATIALLSSVANIGLDTGLLKFVSEFNVKNPQKAYRVMKLTLEIKMMIWVCLLSVGWLAMPLVVDVLFAKPELVVPLRISLLGVGTTLLSSYATTLYQAYSRFFSWSVINVSSNALRLVIVLLLMSFGLLNANTALLSYSFVLFIVFVVGIVSFPQFLKVKNEFSLFSEFMNFNKWIALFTVIAAVASRIDTYVATHFLSLTDVGIYSVGVSLVSFVTQIVLALASVVAPKLTQKSHVEFLVYFKKLQFFVLALAIIGVIVGIPLGSILIPIIYGAAYAPSIMPFSILLVGNALFLVALPIHTSVIYYFAYPRLFVYVTTFRLFLTGTLGFFLIPTLGATGAALSVLIGNISDLTIPAVWVYRKIHTWK